MRDADYFATILITGAQAVDAGRSIKEARKSPIAHEALYRGIALVADIPASAAALPPIHTLPSILASLLTPARLSDDNISTYMPLR